MAKLILGTTNAVSGTLAGAPVGAVQGNSMGQHGGTSLIFPKPLAPGQQEGPKISDVRIGAATYGVPIPIVYGTMRVSGNVIFTTAMIPHVVDNSTTVTQTGGTTGGKGGGGGTSTTSTTIPNQSIVYTVDFAVGLAEGPADSVTRIWADTKLIYDGTGTGAVEVPGIVFRFYPGDEEQLPDPTMQAHLGVDCTSAHRGLAYLMFVGFPLINFGNRIPNISAEISFNGVHSNPTEVTTGVGGSDFLHNANSGLAAMAWDFCHPYLYVLGDSSGFLGTLSRVNRTTHVTEARVILPWDTGLDLVCDCDGFVYFQQDPANYETLWKYDGMTLTPVGSVGPQNALGGVGALRGQAQMFVFDHPTAGKLIAGQGFSGDVWVVNRDTMTSLGAVDSHFTTGSVFTQGGMCVADKNGVVWSLCCHTGDFETWLTKVEIVSVVDILTNTLAQNLVASHYDLTAYIQHAKLITYDAADHSLIIGTATGSSTESDFPSAINNGLIKYDIETGTVIGHLDLSATAGSQIVGSTSLSAFKKGLTGDRILFLTANTVGSVIRARKIDCGNMTILAEYNLEDWQTNALYDYFYDDATNSVWVEPAATGLNAGGGSIFQYYFDRVSGGGVHLDVVVGDLSRRAGLLVEEYDVTQLAPYIVHGYAVSRQISVRAAIEPLAAGYFFDACESDYEIKYVLRGGTPVMVLDEKDLGVIDGSASGTNIAPRLMESSIQEQELPRKVSVVYIDQATDYMQGNQSAQRILAPIPTVDTQDLQTIEVPIVFTSSEAKGIAEKALYLAWISRDLYNLVTLPKYMQLDPTDVVTMTYRGSEFKLRIGHTVLGAGYSLEIQAAADDEVIYISAAVGIDGAGVPVQTIIIVGPTTMLAMDTPLLRDIDSNTTGSGFYFALQAQTTPWTGAVVYKSTDSGQSFEQFTVGKASASSGRVIGTLPPPVTPHTWDRVNTLRVQMTAGSMQASSDPSTEHGTLDSASEFAVLNGANAGWLSNGEVIQWTYAVDNGDGSLSLSNLLRGRRGTEWAVGTHGASEDFVVLDPNNIFRAKLPLSEVGLPRQYKAVSLGGVFSQAPQEDFTLQGNDLKPYSPAYIHGARDGSNNLTITWLRRTRIGGGWIDGTGTVPLSEASEEYEVDILNGGNVVRTINGLTAATASYSAAQQTVDFGSAQPAIAVKVYQLGVLGRGFAGEATV